ncbi:S8 family serine peptidase, partial [bacterium]|nr:S8 family serine peptidase [bacterium]
MLLRFREGVSPADRAGVFAELGALATEQLPWPGAWAVTVPRGSAPAAVSRWSRSPLLASIEPNGYVYATGAIPDDPEFTRQWHLRNVGQEDATGPGTPGADIDAPRAWCITQGNPDVVVAVLDTGVRFDHPDLTGNIFVNPGEIPGNGLDDDHNGKVDDVHGWDFEDHLVTGGDNDPSDTHGHGTLVAGLIAAPADGVGSVGVAPGVTILPVRVLTDTQTSPPSGTHLQVALGIRYAVEMGARVLNCSFGSSTFSGIIAAAIEDALSQQVLVVCGAGNDARDIDLEPFYPASYSYENVISVTATDNTDWLAESFANYGFHSVDLAAPGVLVWGSIYRASNPYDQYGAASGTSFATPQVTGALALLESLRPGLEHPTPREALLANVDSLGVLRYIMTSGGRLDVHKMLAAVSEPDSTSPAAIPDLRVAAVGSHWVELEWTAPGDDGMSGQACCYDVRWGTGPEPPDFFTAAELVGPDPLPGGSLQTYRVEGLEPDTQNWFVIRTKDEAFGTAGFTAPLAVQTLPASIAVTPTVFEWNATTGQEGTMFLELSNPGGAPFDYDVTFDAGWMTVVDGSGTLGIGGSIDVALLWSAVGLPGTTYRADLVIASDAAGADDLHLPVTMTVTAAPDAEVLPTSIALGDVWVGHPGAATVTIRNHGYRTLVVDNVSSDLEGLTGSPASFSLGPLTEREVAEHLVPTAAGLAFGSLTFESNDPFDSSIQVAVTATGIPPPTIDLSAEAVELVGITGSSTDPVPLIVRNLQEGGPDLDVAMELLEGNRGTTLPWLTVDPPDVVVPPQGEMTVMLRFSTEQVDPGVFTADLRVSSNDPDQSVVALPIRFDVGGVAGILLDAELGRFEDTPAGTFREKVVPFTNTGNDTLTVETRLGGSFAAGPSMLLVPPGETGSVRVRYRPQGAARNGAIMRLHTNDPARPLVLLPLTGQGEARSTWSGVIRLDRRVVVPAGESLTLEAGTRVETYAPLDPPAAAAPLPRPALEIRGTLVAHGTAEMPVEFGTTRDSDWDGVIVPGVADLRHVVMEGAGTALRVPAGGTLDLACSRLGDNDVGLEFEGGGASSARVGGTRFANRVANVRVTSAAGLVLYGTGVAQPGRNSFMTGDDAAGGWNVEILADQAALVRLDGNAWFAPDGAQWGIPSVGYIEATIRRAGTADVAVLP